MSETIPNTSPLVENETEDEQDEALVVSLFGLRPESPLFALNSSELQNVDSTPTVLSLGSSASVSSTSDSNLEKQLRSAEDDFLSEKDVNRSGVLLSNLAQRFTKSRIPEESSSVEDYVTELLTSTVNEAVHTSSPNMIGHMTSSLPFFVRPLSRLITTMNQNCVKTETASTMTFLEREAMAQLHREIFEFPDEFYSKYGQSPSSVLGVFTSGGTLANISALWVARNSALKPNESIGCKGIEKGGLFHSMQAYGYTGFAVIGTELLHYSLAKAVDVLGMGLESLVSIPVESDFVVSAARVEEAVVSCKERGLLVVAIVGVAGATETGTIDPLSALSDVAARHGVHFHVDAAWGGPLVFSRKHKHKIKGIEKANTVTLDGHKQLYMPMGCGLLFFQNPELSNTVQKSANYIIRKESYDLGKFTMEGSRPANALYLHSNLNILGARGYELLVNRSCRMTRYMAECIRKSEDFELIVEPVSNILLYRVLPPSLRLGGVSVSEEDQALANAYNVTLQSMQKLRGKTFVSRTTIRSPKHNGARVVALRVVIANPLTYERDIDRVLSDQRSITQVISRVSDQRDVSQVDIEVEVRKVLAPEEDQGPKPENKRRRSIDYMAYWDAFFDNSPEVVKSLFKDDKETFFSTLVAPSNSANDEESGILKDGRYARLGRAQSK